MKQLIMASLLFFSSQGFAQGNLQFNRVINYTLSGTIPASANTPTTVQTITVTVPVNKVWKIESAHCRASNTSNVQNNQVEAYIALDNAWIMANNTSYVIPTFPIWLSAGTHTIQIISDNGSTLVSNLYGLVTGIEFNIIP
jgi:hypothetical protein